MSSFPEECRGLAPHHFRNMAAVTGTFVLAIVVGSVAHDLIQDDPSPNQQPVPVVQLDGEQS